MKFCLGPMRWKLMSDPTGMTTCIAVPLTPDLAGLENIQEGVTKLVARKWWKRPRSFSSVFPTPWLYNQAKDNPISIH